MGYMRHHAIVVAHYNDAVMKNLRDEAVKIFPWVSPISPETVNGYVSFFIPPDGSKEGWGESDRGDENREKFLAIVRANPHYIDYAEVQFGDDEREAKIVNSSDDDLLANPEEEDEDDE